MVKTAPSPKTLIGRAEPIYFVDRLDQSVPAKVDSGAFRSSIHATGLKVTDDVLTCTLLAGHPSSPDAKIHLETRKFSQVTVTNSFGITENRYQVSLKVKLADKTVVTSFTLADRSRNIYPILLGRTFLNKRFIIDTSKTSISRLELKKLSQNFPNESKEELS